MGGQSCKSYENIKDEEDQNCAACLLLGDNFYEIAVKNTGFLGVPPVHALQEAIRTSRNV